jgi:acyl-coenzyme A synthetase/AMP-(fatty) acid ligase
VLARYDKELVTAAHFLDAATTLAMLLPNRRHVVNVCENRFNFLLGFVGAMLAKQTTLLLPTRAEVFLRQVYEQYPEAYFLADHDDVPTGLHLFLLPECFGRRVKCTAIPRFSGKQIAAVIFTSGSSGQPTAHIKTWESLVIGAQTLGQHLGIQSKISRAFLGTVPPQHMYGLETTVMFPLQSGSMIHSARPVLPADLPSALDDVDAYCWLMTTPLQIRACVEEGIMLPNLEGVISSTMPLLPTLAKAAEVLWRVPVNEIYGCTESGMIAMRRPATDETWKMCEGMRIWKNGSEVMVQGRHIVQPVRLDDRISVVNEREFILHGRANDLVKVAGKRASLQALNIELTRIKGVIDGVFYLPEAESGQARLTAFAVAPGLTVSDILTELRKRIDPVFLPRPLCLVSALPRSSTGKLPQESLRTLVADHPSQKQQRENDHHEASATQP